MLSGIYFILRTGLPWRDLPAEFGPWNSVYTRFRRWCRSGLWEKMLALLAADACGAIHAIDCTHIKVHQHGSNAVGGAAAQAVGQTKGGANTKLAVAVDGLGRAVGLNLVPGQRNDQRAVAVLIKSLANCWVVGDRGFDGAPLRRALLAVGATPCIPPRRTNKIHYYYSDLLYAHRHVVENFFARIKRYLRVGTRYEKTRRHLSRHRHPRRGARLASLRGLKTRPSVNWMERTVVPAVPGEKKAKPGGTPTGAQEPRRGELY